MKTLNLIGALSVAALMAACGPTNVSPGNNGGAAPTNGGTTPADGGTTPTTTVSVPAAGGAGSGTPSTSTLQTTVEAYGPFWQAVRDGRITAAAPPTGQATMNGYVVMLVTEGKADGQDDLVLGNLTVAANFDAGKVTTRATDFVEKGILDDPSDPNGPGIIGPATNPIGVTGGGELNGTGTITGSTMTSSLNGSVDLAQGSATVTSTMTGTFYDNGGSLVADGGFSGTVVGPAGNVSGDIGMFTASQ